MISKLLFFGQLILLKIAILLQNQCKIKLFYGKFTNILGIKNAIFTIINGYLTNFIVNEQQSVQAADSCSSTLAINALPACYQCKQLSENECFRDYLQL